MADPSTPAKRQRPSQMASSSNQRAANGDTASADRPSASSTKQSSRRNSPHLPTPVEAAALALYPTLLVFGSIFALLSPEVRSAPYDAASQSHSQLPHLAPSYFARKDNLFNLLFVKRGWAWVSAAFAAFVLTHPHHTAAHDRTTESGAGGGRYLLGRRGRAILRWALVTGWWFLVTQWFFGPPLIDRGFRYTGGKCEAVERQVFGAADGSSSASTTAQIISQSSPAEIFSAAACRAAGGRWRGGHDISGHVFLLVLGSFFLLQEVAWATGLWATAVSTVGQLVDGGRDPRPVVMHDGAVKAADVEGDRLLERQQRGSAELGIGGRIVVAVVALSLWMLLMTAIYFHTWFEKFTGLLVALIGLYVVYILPRWLPGLRRIVGLPGI